MAAVMTVLAGALILPGAVYDTARLITPTEPRIPPLARTDAAAYRRRMPLVGPWAAHSTRLATARRTS
ncbi:hypothetical protein [Streptomyces sp. NPDC097981]|uniref:hypothetical protein n=1 Tax=Streptomyces sp. NPDC097981 TaxID=3155428 RepID=UPI0033322DA3